MDFRLSDEQRMLEGLVSSIIERRDDAGARNGAPPMSAEACRERWRTLAETGLLRLNLPESLGGMDAAPEDSMIVCEALGRGLSIEPYIANAIVAARLLRNGQGQAAARFAERLVEMSDGRRMLAIAAEEVASHYELRHVATRATRIDEGWLLSGRKACVLNGDDADTFIVTVRTSGAVHDEAGITLFLVDRRAPGVTVTGFPTLDGRRLAQVRMNDVRVADADVIGEAHDGFFAMERAVDHGIAALCAEAVGAMQALLELTVEHLRTRTQFGRPIGAFQALQHRLAEMLGDVEQARSMAYAAAAGLAGEDAAARRRTVSAAKWTIGRCGRKVGQAATQLHGGMGMTAEGLSGQYFKRLIAIDKQWGDSEHHAEQFASAL